MNKDQTTLPHWDLSTIYPGLDSSEFLDAVADLKAQLDELDNYLDSQQITRQPTAPAGPAGAGQLAELIGGCLERINATAALYRTLSTYVFAFVATDSYNDQAKRLLSEMQKLGARSFQHQVRFQGWVGSVSDALPPALTYPGAAQEHSFCLQEMAEQSQYLMSEAEESLASEMMLTGATAWGKLQGTVCSQLVVNFERDGQSERLPITALQNLRSDPNPDTRRRAYHAELAAWESVKEPLAAALNGVKGESATLNKRRGRQDALHQPLDQARIDREILETMLGVMQDHFPPFRQYLQAKAARLGHTALPWWDLFAPVGQFERRFTFEEAQAFVIEQFATFSDKLADFARRAFAQHWIDAEPRDGKRGGGFCIYFPTAKESRILCNFDGSLDQVLTIAHELGHAYHNECRIGKTMLNRNTPMTLNETASNFCESIVTDAALAQAANPQEELAILETFLIGATQTLLDITSRYLFEKEVLERRAQAELSADEFCEIMLRSQQATYNDGLDERYRHKYMWAWKPHYYRTDLSFYNYPYAFGTLFSIGLYAIYLDQGADFVADYDTLLANTGQANAVDLAARFGLDIRQPEFWQNSLQVISGRIQRYLAL